MDVCFLKTWGRASKQITLRLALRVKPPLACAAQVGRPRAHSVFSVSQCKC